MTDKTKKDKCEMLIKQIFGSNFYFVHGSSQLETIIKTGKIEITTKLPKKYHSFEGYGSHYVYCTIMYDDVHVDIDSGFSLFQFLIDPRILLHEDVIFNSGWWIEPIPNEKSNKKYFSVYLYKTDSKEERLEKLDKIKKFIVTVVL
jgi:hypothetical protein